MATIGEVIKQLEDLQTSASMTIISLKKLKAYSDSDELVTN